MEFRIITKSSSDPVLNFEQDFDDFVNNSNFKNLRNLLSCFVPLLIHHPEFFKLVSDFRIKLAALREKIKKIKIKLLKCENEREDLRTVYLVFILENGDKKSFLFEVDSKNYVNSEEFLLYIGEDLLEDIDDYIDLPDDKKDIIIGDIISELKDFILS